MERRLKNAVLRASKDINQKDNIGISKE